MKARKALSRILVEVLMIVIVLAALAGAYYVYSMYAGSASNQLAFNVESMYITSTGGANSKGQIILNIKNTGSSTIVMENITATSPNLNIPVNPGQTIQIKPGQTQAVKFDVPSGSTVQVGQIYTVTIQVKDAQGNIRSVQLKGTAV